MATKNRSGLGERVVVVRRAVPVSVLFCHLFLHLRTTEKGHESSFSTGVMDALLAGHRRKANA